MDLELNKLLMLPREERRESGFGMEMETEDTLERTRFAQLVVVGGVEDEDIGREGGGGTEILP